MTAKVTEDVWDSPAVLDLVDEPDSSPLDELFDSYYTPQISESAPNDSEVFLEAVEKENSEILSELENADKSQRMSNTKSAVHSGVDCSYFVSIVFVSEAQKLEFLNATGWEKYGGTRFLNGIEMAKDMGIHLDPAYLAITAHEDKKLVTYERERSQENGKRK